MRIVIGLGLAGLAGMGMHIFIGPFYEVEYWKTFIWYIAGVIIGMIFGGSK